MKTENMIDKTDVALRFRRSMESYDDNALAQRRIVGRLAVLLDEYCPQPAGRILEIGCGTGLLTRRLVEKYGEARLYVNDLVADMCVRAAERCRLSGEQCLPGDMEALPLEGAFGLMVSASTFQWFVRPADTFKRLADHLSDGGRLVFSTFGTDNLRELKALTGEGLVYRSMEEMRALLSGSFEVEYAEESCHVLSFREPMEVLRHVKLTGVNGGVSHQAWSRRRVEEFCRAYKTLYAKDGNYPLTYHPQYFVCRKRLSGRCSE